MVEDNCVSVEEIFVDCSYIAGFLGIVVIFSMINSHRTCTTETIKRQNDSISDVKSDNQHIKSNKEMVFGHKKYVFRRRSRRRGSRKTADLPKQRENWRLFCRRPCRKSKKSDISGRKGRLSRLWSGAINGISHLINALAVRRTGRKDAAADCWNCYRYFNRFMGVCHGFVTGVCRRGCVGWGGQRGTELCAAVSAGNSFQRLQGLAWSGLYVIGSYSAEWFSWRRGSHTDILSSAGASAGPSPDEEIFHLWPCRLRPAKAFRAGA